jgi:hypothetical protein
MVRVRVGRDACGEWAWMLTSPVGAMLDSDWGYATYEGALTSASHAAREWRRSTAHERRAA